MGGVGEGRVDVVVLWITGVTRSVRDGSFAVNQLLERITMRLFAFSAVVAATLIGVAPAAAQKPKEAKKPEGAQKPAADARAHKPDPDIIRDYFKGYSRDRLPPGLAKKDRLPPGLRKQLIRDGELPPGLERDIQPLPRDLDSWLTRAGDGYRRGYLDGVVVVWDVRTRRISSVVDLHF